MSSYMPVSRALEVKICGHCLIRQLRLRQDACSNGKVAVTFHSSARLPQQGGSAQADRDGETTAPRDGEDAGAMSRRLSAMTDESIEHGGRSARKAMDEAGFSKELKQRLEAKIAESNFKNDNPAAFAQVDMPVRAC